MRQHFFSILVVSLLTTGCIVILTLQSKTLPRVATLSIKKRALQQNNAVVLKKYANDEHIRNLFNQIKLKDTLDASTDLDDLIENLPRTYFSDDLQMPTNINESCARYPYLFEIKFSGDRWQTQKVSNGTLYLLNSYLDHRVTEEGKVSVRIISMYNQFNSNDTFYCQFWLQDKSQPVVVQSEKLMWIWDKSWGGSQSYLYHPYIITCLAPKDSVPTSVSIVEEPCNVATNNLRVNMRSVKKEEKKDFMVCVKGLNWPEGDKSVRLLEWIEVVLMLGADKINFYSYNIHPNIQKVLEYYAKKGKVEVTPLSLIGGAPNSPFLKSNYIRKHFYEQVFLEVVAYNDCLYKHLQEYKFVVLLDTDEVIVPKTGTWAELIEEVYEKERSSYIAQNVYFLDSFNHNHEWFDGIPKFLHMLQHVFRAEKYARQGDYAKGFHDTSRVLALHNHFPISCIEGCNHRDIDINFAHLQHYRADCYTQGPDCDMMKNETVLDSRLWNYKDYLLSSILEALYELDMIILPESETNVDFEIG